MKRVVVIGLGIFGFNIVKSSMKTDSKSSPSTRTRMPSRRSRTMPRRLIVADGMDKEVMEMIGIEEDDIVIISFGEDLAGVP